MPKPAKAEGLSQFYQWQTKPYSIKVWINEGVEYTKRSAALKYLPIASACTTCDGHRLVKVTTIDSRIVSRMLLLYAIPPKK